MGPIFSFAFILGGYIRERGLRSRRARVNLIPGILDADANSFPVRTRASSGGLVGAIFFSLSMKTTFLHPPGKIWCNKNKVFGLFGGGLPPPFYSGNSKGDIFANLENRNYNGKKPL